MPELREDFEIQDPSGTRFQIVLNEQRGLGRPIAFLRISGLRISGEPTKVRLKERIYENEIFSIVRSIEDFLRSPLVRDYEETEDEYFPERDAYPISRYGEQRVGFDTFYRKFYYEYSNTRSTHRLLLDDPLGAMERLAGTLDSLTD